MHEKITKYLVEYTMVTLCQVHADHDGGQLLAQLVEPDIAKPNAPRGARWQWTMKAPPRLWVWFNLWRVLCVNLWQQIHIIWSFSLCVCVCFLRPSTVPPRLCASCSRLLTMSQTCRCFAFCFPTPVHNQLGGGDQARNGALTQAHSPLLLISIPRNAGHL